MKISIKSFAGIREAIGSKVIELEVPDRSSIKDVILSLTTEYPGVKELILDQGGLRDDITLVVGERTLPKEKLDTPADPGELIVLLPPTGGG